MTFDALSTSLILSAFRRRSGETRAGERLDQRYADGEMTREEYLTTRHDITRNPDA